MNFGEEGVLQATIGGQTFRLDRTTPDNLLMMLFFEMLDKNSSADAFRRNRRELGEFLSVLYQEVGSLGKDKAKEWRRKISHALKSTQHILVCTDPDLAISALYEQILRTEGLSRLPGFSITGDMEKGRMFYDPERRSTRMTY